MTEENILHYDFIKEFETQSTSDLLNMENLTSEQVHIPKLTFTDGRADDEANFWGYILEKNGKKYIISACNSEGVEINLKTLLPISTDGSLKVAAKGIVYHWIQQPTPIRYKPEKVKNFRQLIDTLSSFDSTNPEHQKLDWFMNITQMLDRAYFRKATPPGFGKDSKIDICGSLFDNAGTVENPTLAKLEFLTYYKHLSINEVVDIPVGEWKKIEPYVLAASAFKPTVTKHSRATSQGVTEVLDIHKHSMTIMYNDIDCYEMMTKYFDFRAKKAIKDRFPCFRLYGTFKTNFNYKASISAELFVKNNYKKFMDLIYTFNYYLKHYKDELHNYNADAFLESLPQRWSTSMQRLLAIIDLYCESQSEFDMWIDIIKNSMSDYKEMLNFPKKLKSYIKKLGMDGKLFAKDNKISTVAYYCKEKGYDFKAKTWKDTLWKYKYDYTNKIIKLDTFEEKHHTMDTFELPNVNSTKEDIQINEFW